METRFVKSSWKKSLSVSIRNISLLYFHSHVILSNFISNKMFHFFFNALVKFGYPNWNFFTSFVILILHIIEFIMKF